MPATLPITPPIVALTEDLIFIAVESAQMSGGGPWTPDQDNLSAYIEIFDTIENKTLATRAAPYSTIDKRCEFNIRSVFNLSHHIPTNASLIWNATTPAGEATNAYTKYKVKYADKYGAPPVPETLAEDTEKTVIFGGRSKGSFDFSPQSGDGLILHRFRDRKDQAFAKPTTATQPEYLYFWTTTATTAVIDVKFYFTDGTDQTVLDVSSVINLANTYAVYWIAAGWEQLDLGSVHTPGKTVYKYEITLRTDDMIPALIGTQEYEIKLDYSDFEEYFLVPNGFGGLESVRFKGKQNITTEIDRELNDVIEWSDFDINTGTVGQVSQIGNDKIKISTGFYDQGYIWHLRQLLRGEIWRVNTIRQRLEKYIIETKKIEPFDDDTDLFSIELEMRPAWNETNFNNWKI